MVEVSGREQEALSQSQEDTTNANLTPTETAYEIGFANGYGTEPTTAEFATLAETQSWESGYDAGKQARLDDAAHRAIRAAQGV